MHVFHIRGLSGFMVFLLAVVSAVLLLLLLPASFMMVLWNALVFESFKGPEISLLQGFLLWGTLMIALKIVFKPEIKFEFQPVNSKKKPLANVKTEEKVETKATSVVVEEPADQS
jgi:hypothetical protein